MSDRKDLGKKPPRGRESAGMWSVMYPMHFGMRENPFPADADRKFLWLGGKRGEILESLVSGILSGERLQVVTGSPGTGKTMMAHALLDQLGDWVKAAVVPCTEYKGIDFLMLVERAFGTGGTPQSQGSFAGRFSEFMRASFSSGKRVVLIVDDAHRLIAPYLDGLSELSGVEENGTRLLNLVYFGESPLLGLLNAASGGDLSKSVIRSFSLDPLTREETFQYIQHRLRQARCEGEPFGADAVDEIFSVSQGIPSLIDRACDAALSRAYYVGEKLVTLKTVKDAFDLMPAEESALPESVPDLSFMMHAEPDREGDEDAGGEDVPGIPAGRVRRRNRRRLVYAAVGCGVVAVAVAAVAFMELKSRPPTIPAGTEVKKTLTQPVRPSADPAAMPPAVTPPAPPTSAGQSPAQPAEQPLPAVDVEKKAGETPEVIPVRKKTRETAASRPPAVRTRQAPAASPTREAVTPAPAYPGSEAVRGASEDSGEAASRGSARQGSEQVESGEVIDFMLKKRSGQR
jgi:type II secretory pathway predicted ATPase ExeA